MNRILFDSIQFHWAVLTLPEFIFFVAITNLTDIGSSFDLFFLLY